MIATDPVCLADVDEKEARRQSLSTNFDKETYFFCSRECKDKFDLHPASYTQRDAESRASGEGMPPGMAE